MPVGCGMADDLPRRVHLNAEGRVGTVVFEGAVPDAAVLDRLEARLTVSGLILATPSMR